MPAPRNLYIAGIEYQKRCDLLLLARANPNEIILQPDTLLHQLAWNNEKDLEETEYCLQTFRELIARGANVDEENHYSFTPLIFAVLAGKWRLVELLLESNADVNHRTYNRKTALHYAVTNHIVLGRSRVVSRPTMRVVKALLRFYPEMNVKDKWGQTPLTIAVTSHDFQIVHELLRHNASANFQDSDRNTALHHALQQAEVDVNIVLELVRHGADFCIRNCRGETPLDVYITRLLDSSSDEGKKALFVLKLYIFRGNPISSSQQGIIDAISKEKKCQLSQFVVHCLNESKKMMRDEIALNYHMYNMALRGFYYRIDERNHVPLNIFDTVLDKLLKGQYPVYCDLIVSGICRPYLNKNFAEMCSSVGNRGIAFLNYDIILSLSFYLSHVDMLNMMLACSPDSISVEILERWHRYSNCSVS